MLPPQRVPRAGGLRAVQHQRHRASGLAHAMLRLGERRHLPVVGAVPVPARRRGRHAERGRLHRPDAGRRQLPALLRRREQRRARLPARRAVPGWDLVLYHHPGRELLRRRRGRAVLA